MSALFELHHASVRLPRVSRVASALADLAGPSSLAGARFLDVGAGDGRVGAELARLTSAEVEGVDVHVQPGAAIPVRRYDGRRLPFADGAFDFVVLADVLHHADDPRLTLGEALRVARRAVLVKDHYRFGPLSNGMLLLLDVAGNASQGILVRGRYFTRRELEALVDELGARVEAETWPLHVHGFPLRLVTRSELQFAARIVRRDASTRSGTEP